MESNPEEDNGKDKQYSENHEKEEDDKVKQPSEKMKKLAF